MAHYATITRCFVSICIRTGFMLGEVRSDGGTGGCYTLARLNLLHAQRVRGEGAFHAACSPNLALVHGHFSPCLNPTFDFQRCA